MPQRTLTIIDNFYENPHAVREYALSLNYSVQGNYRVIEQNT